MRFFSHIFEVYQIQKLDSYFDKIGNLDGVILVKIAVRILIEHLGILI